MLYPLLHRLHRLGFVTKEWRTHGDGRRRCYYAITAQGHKALEEHNRQSAVARGLDSVFGGDRLAPFALATTTLMPFATGPWRYVPSVADQPAYGLGTA